MRQSSILIQLVSLMLLVVSCNSVAEHNNAGNQLTTARNYDEAIIAYSSAQVSQPDNPIPYLNTAQAYFEQGNLDLAIEVLEQAILRGDEQIKAQAHFNMGNFYFLSAEFDNAILAYREALIINPDDSHARQNLELAMLYNSTPTPVDDEMKTEPDESQVDPTSLPTNQPLDFDDPTPTPLPFDTLEDEERLGGQDGRNFGDLADGSPKPTEEATLSITQAIELLDPLKQQDSLFGEFSDEVATPASSNGGKQW